MKIGGLILLFSLTSCGAMRGAWSSRSPFVGEDGNDNWWIIRCHRDEDACLIQASRACLNGYEVKDRDAGPLNTRLLIACNGSGSRRVSTEEYGEL